MLFVFYYSLSFFFSFSFSQEEIGAGLFEESLVNYLQNNYTTPSTLGYTSARNVLYGEIDRLYIECIYFSLELPDSFPPPFL